MDGTTADPSQGSTLGPEEDPLQRRDPWMQPTGPATSYGPIPSRGFGNACQPGMGNGAADAAHGGPETVPPVLSAASMNMNPMNNIPFSAPFGLDVLRSLVVFPRSCNNHFIQLMDLVDYIMGLLLTEGVYKTG